MEKALEILNNSYEKFSNNEFKENFILLKGTKFPNLIISCPHAVQQTREGKIKAADFNTGPLGFALNYLGCTVLIRTKNIQDDPNYDEKSIYKDFLSDYIRKNNIKFLLDLHGMSPKRSIVFSLGTSYGKLTSSINQTTTEFCKLAYKFGIDKVRIDYPFSSINKNTVSSTIKRLNDIETLQLEINSQLFREENLKIDLLNILINFLHKIDIITNYNEKKLNYDKFVQVDKKLFENTFSENIFHFYSSNSNILITAPNACKNFESESVRSSETASGSLAYLLFEDNICDTLIKTKNTDFDSSNQYIEMTSNAINKNNYNFMLELHIMNTDRMQDVTIVCDNGISINHNIELISKITSILNKNNFFNLSIDYPFNPYNRTKAMSVINNQNNIPCAQLIINHNVILNKEKLQTIYKAIQEICFSIQLIGEI